MMWRLEMPGLDPAHQCGLRREDPMSDSRLPRAAGLLVAGGLMLVAVVTARPDSDPAGATRHRPRRLRPAVRGHPHPGHWGTAGNSGAVISQPVRRRAGLVPSVGGILRHSQYQQPALLPAAVV